METAVTTRMSDIAKKSDEELKSEFARALLTHANVFQAALSVVGDTGRALRIAHEWAADPFVLAEKMRILEDDGISGLWTKEEYAKKLMDATEEKDSATGRWVNDFEMRLKGYELFGKVMGYIPRGSETTINNNNSQTVNRVMIVKEHGSNDDWERRLQNQQKQLIAEGASETKH